MWSGQKRVSLCVGAAAAMLLASASISRADYPYGTMTFDNSGTVISGANYDPPPVGARFDYGDGNPALNGNNSAGWTDMADHDGNGGGSIELSADFVGTQTGYDEKAGFTLDLSSYPATATSLSFYLMLAPSSAVDSNSGVDGSGANSGYAQVGIRYDDSYDFINTGDVYVNGNDAGGNGWNLGDPTYSGTSDKGTWEYISIPLSGTDSTIRAITIQDYEENSTSGRTLDGPVTMYIDDLTIAPEPASLALLGLGLPVMLLRRRIKA